VRSALREGALREGARRHSGGDGTAVRGEGEWWLAGMPRLMCVLVNGLSLVGELSFITHNHLRLSLHSSSLVRSTRR
jgi:hypothetical protein